MKARIEGRAQINPPSWDAPQPPAGMRDIPCFHIPKDDPYIYGPMGSVDLHIGERVFIRSMDGTGEWCYGIVLKRTKNGDGLPHSWWIIGSDQQLSLDI